MNEWLVTNGDVHLTFNWHLVLIESADLELDLFGIGNDVLWLVHFNAEWWQNLVVDFNSLGQFLFIFSEDNDLPVTDNGFSGQWQAKFNQTLVGLHLLPFLNGQTMSVLNDNLGQTLFNWLQFGIQSENTELQLFAWLIQWLGAFDNNQIDWLLDGDVQLFVNLWFLIFGIGSHLHVHLGELSFDLVDGDLSTVHFSSDWHILVEEDLFTLNVANLHLQILLKWQGFLVQPGQTDLFFTVGEYFWHRNQVVILRDG